MNNYNNVSINSLLLKPLNLNYYEVIVNENESTLIKYSEIKIYIYTFVKNPILYKQIQDLIKDYKYFLFLISEQKIIELTEKKIVKKIVKKQNLKNSIKKNIIEKNKEIKKEKKKKNSDLLLRIYNNINKKI